MYKKLYYFKMLIFVFVWFIIQFYIEYKFKGIDLRVND